MLGWMNYKLESRFLGEINNLRYADDTNLMAESEMELKSLLMKVKEESKNSWLKTQHYKKKKKKANIMASGRWQIEG